MSFKLNLAKATENIKQDAERVVRGTIFSVASKIVRRTPVGNPQLWKNPPPKGYVGGSLRGGWNASLNSPDYSETGRIDSNGGQVIADISAAVAGVDIGDTFYLTNPLPYATRVEFGWSQQAPAGMVRVSVNEAQTVVDNLT